MGKLMFGIDHFSFQITSILLHCRPPELVNINHPVTQLDNGTFEVLPALTNPIFFCNLRMTGAEIHINHVNTHTLCLAAVHSKGSKCTVPEVGWVSIRTYPLFQTLVVEVGCCGAAYKLVNCVIGSMWKCSHGIQRTHRIKKKTQKHHHLS